ncbi:hypothetical protein ACE1TH_11950 [Shouchella sp. JSM 1781072]
MKSLTYYNEQYETILHSSDSKHYKNTSNVCPGEAISNSYAL